MRPGTKFGLSAYVATVAKKALYQIWPLRKIGSLIDWGEDKAVTSMSCWQGPPHDLSVEDTIADSTLLLYV